jgi:hypothetical protein
MKKIIAIALVMFSSSSFAMDAAGKEACDLLAKIGASAYDMKKSGVTLQHFMSIMPNMDHHTTVGISLVFDLPHKTREDAASVVYSFCAKTSPIQ